MSTTQPSSNALIASWRFSIVIPAVLETAALVGSFAPFRRLANGPPLLVAKASTSWLVPLGAVSLLAVLAWPGVFFPLTWLSLLLILDPINWRRGRPGLLVQAAAGNWALIVSLALGALICGFFWEMWNYWAWPKWYYSIPAFNFLRLFEMPLLGYGGYLPFGLEVYAAYHFLAALADLSMGAKHTFERP